MPCADRTGAWRRTQRRAACTAPGARVAWRATSPTTSRRGPRRIELHLDLVDEVERGLDGPAHQLSQNRPPWRCQAATTEPITDGGSAAATPTRSHRASTPLELLYDLTIVVAFGTAADELAHYVAEDHVGTGVLGLRVRHVRRDLGVAELLVVRVGLRHRRLGLPPGDDGADGRGHRAVARTAADVRIDRSRRHARQPRDGGGLRDHARGAGLPVVAGLAPRSRAGAGGPLVHGDDRRGPGRLGHARHPRARDRRELRCCSPC